MDISIYAPIICELAEWAKDQADNLETCEIRLNFLKREIELYDYETGVIESKRPLQYFKEDE